jgi:conserved hypothetical protein
LFFAALVELFGGFLYSLAWYIILKPSGVNVSIKQAYFITMGSLFLIYTTPSGITAEAARIAMTKKHAAGDYGGPAASVVVHRIIYGLGFVSVASLATFLVYGAISSSPFIKTIFYAIITTLILAFTAVIISIKANILRNITKKINAKVEPFLKKFLGSTHNLNSMKIDETFDNFLKSIRRIAYSRFRLIASYLVITIRWILLSVVALLVTYSIGYYKLSIWEVMIVMMIAEIVSTTPIAIPGMLGILDAAVIGSYVALGTPVTIATSIDLLTRLILFVVNIPLTGTLFYKYLKDASDQQQNKS